MSLCGDDDERKPLLNPPLPLPLQLLPLPLPPLRPEALLPVRLPRRRLDGGEGVSGGGLVLKLSLPLLSPLLTVPSFGEEDEDVPGARAPSAARVCFSWGWEWCKSLSLGPLLPAKPLLPCISTAAAASLLL